MTLYPTIQTWIFRQERTGGFPPVLGLFGIEIVDTVNVHRARMQRIGRRIQRRFFGCFILLRKIRLRPARARPHKFFFQPLESTQVVPQGDFRIAALLRDESNGPNPATFQNHPEHGLLMDSLGGRHDL